MTKKYKNRFYSKIDKQGPYPNGECLLVHPWLAKSRCHLWTDYCDNKGYGRFSYKSGKRRKMRLAHRISYKLKHGKIPKGLDILHYCDNTSCVNGKHLFVGTNLANVRDCIMKGRNAIGSKHGRSKLIEKEVTAIHKLYATGDYYQRELGDLFGVTQSLISYILSRSNWTHI